MEQIKWPHIVSLPRGKKTVQYVEKAATVNMGKHFRTQRRKVMTIIWGICGEILQISSNQGHNIQPGT